MANVSYLRPEGASERASQRTRRSVDGEGSRAPRRRWIVGGIVLLALIVVVGGGLIFVTSKATLSADSVALATIKLPRGGGTIETVTVTTGPHSQRVPVELRGTKIWPKGTLPAHQLVTIDAVVKRPGWIGWAAGSTQKLHLKVMTPVTKLKAHFLTIHGNTAPIKLTFLTPIRVISYGPPGQVKRHELGSPQTTYTIHRPATAGTIDVAAAPRTWETSKSAPVSWFPAGSATGAVSNPSPGGTIQANTPITLTFSKTGLAGARQEPARDLAGDAGQLGHGLGHTIKFSPTGYGYGLGAKVSVGLPSGVSLVGAPAGRHRTGRSRTARRCGCSSYWRSSGICR